MALRRSQCATHFFSPAMAEESFTDDDEGEVADDEGGVDAEAENDVP